jgi:hypothetical protein
VPPLFWTIHQIPLWLPDRWTALDDYLLEIDATIREHNSQLTPKDFYVNRIAWTPWRTLIWLWRREWVVLHGRFSYRDPEPVIIAALVAQRSVRNFSYDGECMRHAAGEGWYGVEVIAAEVLTGAAPAEPGIGNAEPPAPAPANPDHSDPGPEELRLPNIHKVEPSAPQPERPILRRRGRPSQKQQIVDAFNDLSDDLIRKAKTLTSLFPAIREKISGGLTATGEPAKGFDDETLRRHLAPLFTERRQGQDPR